MPRRSRRFRRTALAGVAVAMLGMVAALPVAATEPATYTASFLCDRGDVPGTGLNQYSQPPWTDFTSCADGQVKEFAAGTIEIEVRAVVSPTGLVPPAFPTVTGLDGLVMIPDDGRRPTPGQCKSTSTYVACNFTMPANDVTFLFHVATPDTVSAFRSPVDAAPTVNQAQAGRVIPFKFSVSDIDGPVTDLTDTDVDVVRMLTTCDSGATVDAMETYGSGTGLVSLGSGDYLLSYKTNKAWAGLCGTLTVKTPDGGSRSAPFAFR
jgi:hypothetical protein